MLCTVYMDPLHRGRLCLSPCSTEPEAVEPELAFANVACAPAYTGCAIPPPLAGGAQESDDNVYDNRCAVACAVILTRTKPTYSF
jgi:hypothetical protein